MDIHSEGAEFEVVCKRCGKKYNVIRNWGGGIRIDYPNWARSNPAQCTCGSRQLELW